MIITFGYVGGPPGSPSARPVTFDTTSNLTPHRYFILKGGYCDGSEIRLPWQAQLKCTYWPIPVTGCVREGDIAGGISRLDAHTSIAVSVAEWIALTFAQAA
jgi:hypothetical protein